MTTAVLVAPPQVTKKDIAALAVGGSLASILDKLATIEPPRKVDAAQMPEVQELQPVLATALQRVPEVFNSVRPKSRRKLNLVELKALADERQTIDAVLKALTARKADIAEIASTHFDVRAESEGRVSATTERDADGHYRISLPGNREEEVLRDDDRMWVREGTEDSSEVSSQRLELLYKQGLIPASIYRDMTVETRKPDEGKIRALLANPRKRKAALAVLARVTVTKKGVNRINLRSAKNRTK